MKDFWRESLSYFGIYRELRKAKHIFEPEKVCYGDDTNQYFYYYEPSETVSHKVIVWIHGGGWNAGTPKDFDYVGQHIAGAGYRFLSLGYRLSPKNKYPAQIEDVCNAYNRAIRFLEEKNVDHSQIILCGSSAGAHLSSILTYGKDVQDTYRVDISHVIGYVGWGGPYCFNEKASLTLRLLLNQLFEKGYDRKRAEPISLMRENHVPMLLVQSRHDGLIDFSFAEDFRRRAEELGIRCELYEVTDRLNTHSFYTAGLFLKSREENRGLDKFFSWIEKLSF